LNYAVGMVGQRRFDDGPGRAAAKLLTLARRGAADRGEYCEAAGAFGGTAIDKG